MTIDEAISVGIISEQDMFNLIIIKPMSLPKEIKDGEEFLKDRDFYIEKGFIPACCADEDKNFVYIPIGKPGKRVINRYIYPLYTDRAVDRNLVGGVYQQDFAIAKMQGDQFVSMGKEDIHYIKTLYGKRSFLDEDFFK